MSNARPMPATLPSPIAHTTDAKLAHDQYWNGRSMRNALPIAFLDKGIAVEPPEARGGEHRDHHRGDQCGGNQRPQGGAPVDGRDQHCQCQNSDQREAVVEEDRPAQQKTGACSGQQRDPRRASRGQCQQRDAPGRHTREITVGRDCDPDRRRCHGHEWCGQPCGRFVGDGPHRDDDRGGRAGSDQQAQQPRPGAAAQADAVQPDERQQRPWRMARDVRDPRVGLESRGFGGRSCSVHRGCR